MAGFLPGCILGQHGAQSARLASTVASCNGSPVRELLEVHDRVDRLILVVDAIWPLLEESGYTDEQLMARIEEIDSADGAIDGKRTAQIAQCVSCEAKIAAGLDTCQFCGAAVPDQPHDPLGKV